MASVGTADTANDCRGVFFIISSETLLALVNAIVKHVHDWSTPKMMITRNTVDFCLCMIMCAFLGYEVPGRKVSSFLCLRGIAYISFIIFLWASLHSCLPLGDVVVLVVTFSPIFLVLLARLLLNEKIPQMWPLQFALCMIGALLINKPLAPAKACPAYHALLPLAAAFTGALMNLASRNVKDVPPPVVCVYNDVIALIFAIVTGKVSSHGTSLLPDQIDCNLGLLVLAGIIGWVGLLCNVKGYQSVSVSAVASIAAYASVPLGYTLQVVLFGEMPDAMSAAGAILIVCTNVAVILAKYRASKGESAEQKQEDYKLLQAEASPDDKALGA